MDLTLTLWQKRGTTHPTRAGETFLTDPTAVGFDLAVAALLGGVEAPAKPFQIVAQVGNSSRGVQLGQGWSDARITSELWDGYLTLANVNG
ncbi:hypothetical protein EON82_02925 [bacterium]|nr:MAG: hypothetical protein EON82_02925 [bacterium]